MNGFLILRDGVSSVVTVLAPGDLMKDEQKMILHSNSSECVDLISRLTRMLTGHCA